MLVIVMQQDHLREALSIFIGPGVIRMTVVERGRNPVINCLENETDRVLRNERDDVRPLIDLNQTVVVVIIFEAGLLELDHIRDYSPLVQLILGLSMMYQLFYVTRSFQTTFSIHSDVKRFMEKCFKQLIGIILHNSAVPVKATLKQIKLTQFLTAYKTYYLTITDHNLQIIRYY